MFGLWEFSKGGELGSSVKGFSIALKVNLLKPPRLVAQRMSSPYGEPFSASPRHALSAGSVGKTLQSLNLSAKLVPFFVKPRVNLLHDHR